MRFRSALAAVTIAISFAPTLSGTEGFLLELVPTDGLSGPAVVDLHGWLTAPETVSEIHLDLRVNPGLIAETSVILSDAFKGPGLSARSTLSGDVATVSITFDPAHLPAAGERTEAFLLRFCPETPTPHPVWTFPAEVLAARARLVGGSSSVDVTTTVPPVKIFWGDDRGPLPCYHQPRPPEFITCVTQLDGTVLLTWSNPEAYDEIEVYSTRQFFLAGDATSWLDEEGGAANNYVYELKAWRWTGEDRARTSEIVQCAAEDPRTQVAFVRGDVNADGFLSTADMIALQRWAFAADYDLGCVDASDLNDDGQYSLGDAFAIAYYLFGTRFSSNGVPFVGGDHPPAPFPAPGFDPTHVGEKAYMSCDRYQVVPPETSNDVLRIGDVEASAGDEAFIPIYLTNERPIEAVQLVVKYDPSRLRIVPGADSVSYQGSYFEQFDGQSFTYHDEHNTSTFTYRHPDTHLAVNEDDGIFTAAIIGHTAFPGLLAIPPAVDTLVAKVRVEVSPDVPPGTVLRVDPVNGPDGNGYGLFRLHNELTYKGDARYATLLPRQEGGQFRIGVDGDISFFIRGDSNGDQKVDVSDAVVVLAYLFLGAEEPSCLDALDADDSGGLLITDAVLILTELFSGQAHIAPPYPEAGSDPSPDFLKRCAR